MTIVRVLSIIILLCTFININDIVIPVGNTIVNPLLVTSYTIGGLLFVFRFLKKGLYTYEFLLIAILVWMFIVSSLKITFSLNSFIYSCLFITGTISFTRAVKEDNLYNIYFKTIRFLIIAFFVALIYQQIAVTIGLPQLNECPINFTNKYKLNSLSFEPSHTARYMIILMIAYIEYKEIISSKKYSLKDINNNDQIIWISFLYVMLTIGSATAIIFTLMFFTRFVSRKEIFKISVIIAIISAITISLADEIEAINRSLNVLSSLIQSDTENLASTDSSSSTRILPMFEYFKNININHWDFWFGTANEWIIRVKISATDFYTINGAGFFGYLNKYGIISGILYSIFIVKFCYCNNGKDFIVLLLSAIYSGFNSPMSWAAIIIMLTNKNLSNQKKYGNNK